MKREMDPPFDIPEGLENVFTLRELSRRSTKIGHNLAVLQVNRETPQKELDYIFSKKLCRGDLNWGNIPGILHEQEYMNILLLFESSEIVGFIVYEQEDYWTIYIHLFCTAVAKKGHGTLLFREMARRLDPNIQLIKLDSVSNLETIRFYLNLGFRGVYSIPWIPNWGDTPEKYMEQMERFGLRENSVYKM